MSKSRETIVGIMQSWLGKKESDGSHREIIDLYNTIKPLPRNYKVQYTDAWCATCVSAAFHKAGYEDYPFECSCWYMVNLAIQKGIWVENDAYRPNPGDVIMYDWQDNGVGDNTGSPDHVGIVESVNGDTMTIIEGNFSDSVKRRSMAINGQFIRGYITYDYDAKESTTTEKKEEKKETKKTSGTSSKVTEMRATAYAQYGPDSAIAGTYETTANLYIRNDAGVSNKALGVLPKGTKVKNYGYYSMSGSTKWLYIQVTLNNVKYTGFSSSRYLKKV